MLSEPRTINYLSELIHVPISVQVENLRLAYSKLCEKEGYENFIRTADGCRIEAGRIEGQVPDKNSLQGEQLSSLTFKKDRIQIVEENNRMSLEQYRSRVESVAQVATEVLKVPLFLVHQTTVRAITTPNCYKSAGEFLSDYLFKIQASEIQPLGRPTSVVGLRLLFPPTQNEPSKFNVRVETYLKEPRSLYLENVATFQQPTPAQSLSLLGEHVEKAANFVSNNLWTFLTQYDIPKQP